MEGSTTADTPTEAQPPEETNDTDLQKVWTELDRNGEGVKLVVYEQYGDGEVVVRDEAWWTWPEFTGMSNEDLNTTETGTVQMDVVDQENILTADNILDVVFETDLSFVNFGELKGEIGNEPVYDELEIPPEEDIKTQLNDEL